MEELDVFFHLLGVDVLDDSVKRFGHFIWRMPGNVLAERGCIDLAAAPARATRQVLRSFTVGEEPTPLYRDLHAAAEAAFAAVTAVLRHGATPAQVIEASGVIEDAGFTVIDDLLHGYGGGYFPPILGTRSRPGGPVPEEPFEAGMMVVVQPNVATRDGKAGVQTGELVLITQGPRSPIFLIGGST